jgi:hypothetical protein
LRIHRYLVPVSYLLIVLPLCLWPFGKLLH